MSDADNAWLEWQREYGIGDPPPFPETAFMAGYRRALEDAADAVEPGRDFGWLGLRYWLRDRAASVGTKDGASDHE